jgi:hypothetical protein
MNDVSFQWIVSDKTLLLLFEGSKLSDETGIITV